MKKLIIALLTITITSAAWIVYEMQSIQHPFGAAFIILTASVLGSLSLLLLITLLLYERPGREMVTRIWLFVISLSMTYVSFDLVSGYFLIETRSPRTIPDKHVHHKLVPNTHLKFAKREYNYIQTINNLGLRAF